MSHLQPLNPELELSPEQLLLMAATSKTAIAHQDSSHLLQKQRNLETCAVGIWAATNQGEDADDRKKVAVEERSDARLLSFNDDNQHPKLHLQTHTHFHLPIHEVPQHSYGVGSGQSKERLLFPRPVSLPIPPPTSSQACRPITDFPALTSLEPFSEEETSMPQYIYPDDIEDTEPLNIQIASSLANTHTPEYDSNPENMPNSRPTHPTETCTNCHATFSRTHKSRNLARHSHLKHKKQQQQQKPSPTRTKSP